MPWATFVGLFVATGTAMLGIGIIIPILPLYAQQLGASSLLIGAIVAGFAVSRGVLGPVIGRLSDRRGRKRILLAGLALYGLLSLGYVVTGSPVVVGVVRFLQGAASAMVTPVAQSYVGDITPEGREGEVMNLFYIALFAGVAVGPLVGGILADGIGITAPFYAMAVSAGVAIALVVAFVPASPANGDATNGLGFAAALRAVWDDREMRGILSYIAARGFYRWGFNSFFPVFAVGVVALSKTQVGLLLSGYMAVGGLLQYPLGRLSDRYADHRAAFVGVGGTLAALALLAVPSVHGLLPLGALLVGMGAASTISRSATVAIRTERGRVHGMGAVTGAFTTALSAGQVVGPLGFGVVVDHISIRAAFYLGGAVGILGTVVAVWYLVEAERAGAAVAVGSDD